MISVPPYPVEPMLSQVLLLGSGDSGKSTILKQMRLIHRVPFSSQEIESYRQLIFNNLTHGLKNVIDAMEDMELEVSPENRDLVPVIEDASDIKDGEPFPTEFHTILKRLWEDPNVQAAYARGNEAALPEKCVYPSYRIATALIARSPSVCSITLQTWVAYLIRHMCLTSRTSSMLVPGQLASPKLSSPCATTTCSWSMSVVRRASDGSGYTASRTSQAYCFL